MERLKKGQGRENTIKVTTGMYKYREKERKSQCRKSPTKKGRKERDKGQYEKGELEGDREWKAEKKHKNKTCERKIEKKKQKVKEEEKNDKNGRRTGAKKGMGGGGRIRSVKGGGVREESLNVEEKYIKIKQVKQERYKCVSHSRYCRI